MPSPSRAGRRGVVGAVLLALLLVVSGCTTSSRNPDPTPTPGATPRPFTVMSTDPVRVTDPAAMTDAGSSMLAVNVFQRLMSAAPGTDLLKPDAARDCVVTAPTTYTCTLNKDLVFPNGHPLTSSDVKFSIERATRLNVPGSSAPQLASWRKIETPDDLTVRFLLKRVDTQFGWALASPAASILDEESYNPDQISSPKDPIVGSGPFQVSKFDENEIQFDRNPDYSGRNPAGMAALVYRTAPDSATIEDAMTKGTVDVAWRGLDAAAVTRLSTQVLQSPDKETTGGFTQQVLTGTRVLQLEWSPRSPMRSNKGLRQAMTLALQGDRTSDSVVPGGVPGHAPSFALGGRTRPKVTWKSRINLTLGYDPTTPNGQDVATQLRTRLEDLGELSVRLRPGDPDADLQLVDRKAWTATAMAWLQPYLDAPLPGSAKTAAALDAEYRQTYDDATAVRLLAALQKQAATDQLVLPISQSDDYLYVRTGVIVSVTSYGPGWQFGLFGIRNA